MPILNPGLNTGGELIVDGVSVAGCRTTHVLNMSGVGICGKLDKHKAGFWGNIAGRLIKYDANNSSRLSYTGCFDFSIYIKFVYLLIYSISKYLQKIKYFTLKWMEQTIYNECKI